MPTLNYEKIAGDLPVPSKGGDVMRQKIRLFVIILTLAALMVPLTAHAAVVGRFSLVTGQVELLKQGKLPAIAVKAQDGVEVADVVRTKSKSKAELTMVDDSVITLAPDTRLAIADYQYNPAQQERRAVVRLFRGLVHTVVNRIIKTEEPDFIMETHTATIGVRGTNWYTLQGPNFSLVALRNGFLAVNGITLHSMQFIHAPKPLVPQTLTPEILRMLEKMMDTGISGGGLNLGGLSSGQGGQFQSPVNPLLSPDQKLLLQTIPPVLMPQQQQPAPVRTQPFGT
jgi:hypothetical protein